MKSKSFFFLVLIVQMLTFIPTSEASFLRFWRGFPKGELSLQQFNSALNDIFLPATAALAKTTANLISYQPLLLPEYLLETEKLPVELALVEYASEAEYRSYRETEEGQAYSNLHWNYFEKSTSKSTVPTAFAGVLESEKAYLLGGNIHWTSGPTFFYLLPNNQTVLKEFASLSKAGFKGVVLVAPSYVLVYAKSFLSPTLARFLLWETTLRKGTTIGNGSGVQYPL